MVIQELLDLAIKTAKEAGDFLATRLRQPHQGVASKAFPNDMVSEVDRASERLIVERITRARPNDEIVGEEGASVAGKSGLKWLIDPLDGTTNYLYRIPHFSVSIACADETDSLVGVVLDPMRQELFVAARGGGANLNGAAIHVRSETRLAASLIATGFSPSDTDRNLQAAVVARLLPRIRDLRRAGTASLDLCWLAAGRLDGYYEVGIKPWDWGAGALLAREAGGRTETLPAIGPAGPGLLAATDAIFDELLTLVRG